MLATGTVKAKYRLCIALDMCTLALALVACERPDFYPIHNDKCCVSVF